MNRLEWELTGNHYLALPWIERSDGSIHGVNVLHRGLASLVTWAGSAEPAPGGQPLLRLRVVEGASEELVPALSFERLDRWILRWTGRFGDVGIAATICAPGGFDPLSPGAVISVQVDTAGRPEPIDVMLEGNWAYSLRTAASTRLFLGPNRILAGPASVVLEAGEMPTGAALAVQVMGPGAFAAVGGEGVTGNAEQPAVVGREVVAANGEPLAFRLGCRLEPGRQGRHHLTFALGVAPDRDGALAAAGRLGALGGEEVVRRGRLDLATLNRATDDVSAREVVARNLVFHHYFGAARAIDDDRLYPVMSRSPDHGPCAVFGEHEALSWSLPAFALTDPLVARELLMRMLETYSDRPGNYRRYMDGGILDAGFSMGRSLDYGLAIERYIDITGDGAFADEPLVQQVFRELDESAWTRLHPEVFLAGTEVLPGGERADYPFCAWDNVMLWRLGRTVDRFLTVASADVRPRLAKSAAEVEAAFWQRFVTEVGGLTVIACSSDLHGLAAVYDDPEGSLRLLPHFGFCEPDDPIWSNTMEFLHSTAYPLFLGGHGHPGFAGRSRPGEARFVVLCADLLCSWRDTALQALRSLDLPAGVACVAWDPETGAVARGPYAASEAGFLVWAALSGTTPVQPNAQKRKARSR